jgi:hypothetical protein
MMLDWAADEGWNPGLGDAAAFFAVDPEGFSGLFVGEDLSVTISAVRYDAHFVLVAPRFPQRAVDSVMRRSSLG